MITFKILLRCRVAVNTHTHTRTHTRTHARTHAHIKVYLFDNSK